MSFCNPTTIDDFFPEEEPKFDLLNIGKDVRYPAPTTAPDFTNLSQEQLDKLGKTLDAGGNVVTKDTVSQFFVKSKQLGKDLTSVSNYFNRFGLTAQRVDQAFARLLDPNGAVNVGNFFRDFDKMKSAWGDMQSIIGEGLGLDNQQWYRDFKNMQEQAAPVGNFISKLGALVNASDSGGTDITDELITSLFTDIANASIMIFGEDNGLSKALTGLADIVATTQATVRFLVDGAEALEDGAMAALDIAESMMVAGLGMAAAICEFIPTFLAMCRSVCEMIAAMIAALLAFLADPLGNLPKFNLNIDFSKLFRLPDLLSFRRLRSRWDRFTGTAFKLWKTVGAECSPDAWNSRLQGPGKVSEAALSLSKATGYAAQLATATGDAPEGIAGVGKKFDLDVGAAGASFLNFTGKSKSMVGIQPARVNTTPATAGLLGFRTGSTVPSSPELSGFPFGMGSLNPAKASEQHPDGIAIVPGIGQSIANQFDVMSDATAIARSAEVCASSTYDCGRAIKDGLAKDATEAQKKDALTRVLGATRRQRFIQNGIFNPTTGAQSNIASDYYACEEKAIKSPYTISNMQEAVDKLPSLFNQPAGLPGSIMEMAARNNPDKFVTSTNNETGPTTGHIVVLPPTEATTPNDGSSGPMSAEAQLAELDLQKISAIDDPNQILISPANRTLDAFLEEMPLTAFPPTFHDDPQKLRLSGLISSTNTALTKLPLFMTCKDQSELSRLLKLISLSDMILDIDKTVADNLVSKAFTQSISENNPYTWLAIGRQRTDLASLEEMLVNFLLHSRTDIRPTLNWLKSSADQELESPAVITGLSEDETALAQKSYLYLKTIQATDLSEIFITLRLNADEVGGPLGYQAIVFLAIDGVSKQAETRTIAGEDMKSTFETLFTMADKLTSYPAFVKQLKVLARGAY